MKAVGRRRHSTVLANRAAITLALSIFLVFIFIPGGVQAAGGGDGCNPGRSSNFIHHYWSGIIDVSPGAYIYGGIRGNLLNYSPWVYNSGNSTDGPDATTQWVMLDNQSDWAQVGWIEWYSAGSSPSGQVRNTFVEYQDAGVGGWDNYFPSFAINSTIGYKVTYDPYCPNGVCFWFYDNYSVTALTGSRFAWSPTQATAQSETLDAAAQVPGGYDNPAVASGLQVYYNAGGGAWNTMFGETDTRTSSGNVPSWDVVYPASGSIGGDYYNSWDAACAD